MSCKYIQQDVLEEAKRVIIIRKSMKNRRSNGQKKKDKQRSTKDYTST
jgi:hypothetical protein